MHYPIDHIGIAVENLERSIAKFKEEFGFELEVRENIPHLAVEVAFLRTPNVMLELLQPTSADSDLARSINKRGYGMHHICYKVEDIEVELLRFKSMGYRLIDDRSRSGSRNSRIAFIHPQSTGGLLTELCQFS